MLHAMVSEKVRESSKGIKGLLFPILPAAKEKMGFYSMFEGNSATTSVNTNDRNVRK